MRRIFAFLLFLGLLCAPALAQQQIWQYANITLAAPTTTVLKSKPGYLHSVCINTVANSETITIYDNAAASGNKIGTITVVTGVPSCLVYDVAFWQGLTVVTATAASYRLRLIDS